MSSIRRLFRAPMLALALAACSGSASASHHVDGAEAHTLVEHGATLLDVRTQGEWEGGHLPGAVLVPIAELESRMSEVPRDHPVVVYCQSGGRSARATELLAAAGYDVHDLGGIGNW